MERELKLFSMILLLSVCSSETVTDPYASPSMHRRSKQTNLRARSDVSRNTRQLNITAYEFSSSAMGPVSIRKDWMKTIANNTQLTALSIPGTHDSMTFTSYLLELAHCQSMTLQGQLQSGIRALDIRCRHIDNACAIHHGPIYLNSNFNDVMKTVTIFLKNHPSEAIFMRIKGNEDEPLNNTRTWDQTLAAYKLKYKQIIWSGNIQSTIPTLQQIRGKIVMEDTTVTWESIFSVQDDFKVFTNWNLYDKWTNVKMQLDESAKKNAKTMYVNFLSGTSPYGLSAPWFVASGHMDPRPESDFLPTGIVAASNVWPDFPRRDCTLGSICSVYFEGISYLFYNYAKEKAVSASNSRVHLGIIYADFPGKDLIDVIIQQNNAGKLAAAG
eukprot:CAMPEP_0172433048 /NCGR_PEP_ID=MMETSP1064-20121228/66254_1 /TAXON_ID=202472 /ORGANISM="Aulacoseira subarctica , Strain CCAP 1002/5" /LENGTH=384 /DNA_ID=CAMNT_0013180745 /DNA_START=51 /DNA_END=1205 /DNA_ORIENTATION=+